MAYFLKKSKTPKGLYLQIYESYYNKLKKDTSHRSVQKIGYVVDLTSDDMPDPVAHFTRVVQEMNDQRSIEKTQMKVGDTSPEVYLGYFPLKSVLQKLDVEKYIDLLSSVRDFQFSVYDVLSSLVFARCINPVSKLKTFHDVLPSLAEPCNVSYDQILDCCEYIGSDYRRIVEIFTHATREHFSLDTSKSYFDCTNFYFEIDREDDFRKKGPGKEHRPDPIVGLGLLLDADCIPIGMKTYPGNESEKPILREVISELKSQNNITGKTIQVADKGLNCAENILACRKANDGYLFSKSIKGRNLPQKEKMWVFNPNLEWKDVYDETGLLKYRYTSCIDDYSYHYTDASGKKITFTVKEKRVLTYNPKLADKQQFEIRKLVEKAKMKTLSQAKKDELGECAKYVNFVSQDEDGESTGKKAKATINQDKIDEDMKCAGYNLLVTSELNIPDEEIYKTYHRLWRIEESFRVMKSELDARPVYLQKKDSIIGHFTICYLSVLLLRLLQIKIMKDEFGSEKIMEFMRTFRVVSLSQGTFVNISRQSKILNYFETQWKLPVANYFLSEKQIRKVLSHEEA